MKYVELNRNFVPLSENQEPELDLGGIWGPRIAGWVDWPELLKRRRVILLAEAAGGKTCEFRHQADALSTGGKAAFFARIEDLADEGLELSLDPPSSLPTFEKWRDGSSEEGWFFLDSVDEARLHSKSIDRALRHFAQGIGNRLGRVRVYISCRASDWHTDEDRRAVERLLPIPPEAPASECPDRDVALLAPFRREEESVVSRRNEEKPELDESELTVVQLVPLDSRQRRAFAVAVGIQRPDEFADCIEKNGLDTLASRPGDLLDLVGYWQENNRFGSLTEMTEFCVNSKLSERNRHRTDNVHLSATELRHGAERVAAALTLCKSWTIRLAGSQPDGNHATRALDSAAVLPEWSDEQRNVLLRRGVFVPSTYSRVRFHHRKTQEYLCARWLSRLLEEGCPHHIVWQLIFTERYGVETIVPSLQAVAAWLAMDHPDIRREIIRREPLVLLRHGDPRSLSVPDRQHLLLTYAQKHAAGNISDDRIGGFDYRRWGMFATPELGPAVREAWSMNNRENFWIDMLVLIREGRIRSCSDLALSVVLGNTTREALRIIALHALDACDDTEGLQAAAQWLLSDPSRSGDRLGPEFAVVLFPRFMTVNDLLNVVKAHRPQEHSIERFSRALHDLWSACPDNDTQEQLIAGLSDVILSPLLDGIHDWTQHLVHGLFPIVREAVMRLGGRPASEGLIRALMAIERCCRGNYDDDSEQSLSDLVSTNQFLQRRLFWADIEETDIGTKGQKKRPIRFWQAQIHGHMLWRLDPKDLPWLFEDLAERPLLTDRQVALNAIAVILSGEDRLQDEAARLKEMVAGQEALEWDLDRYLAPPAETEQERKHREESERRKQEWVAEREKEKQETEVSWINFRRELEAAPDMLCDPDHLSHCNDDSVWRLHWLAEWLRYRSEGKKRDDAEKWQLLSVAFDESVARAYRDGTMVLWRITEPERPTHAEPNLTTRKWTSVLSLVGLTIEANKNAGWASRLTDAEAERAALHACLSEEGYLDWFTSLAETHPDQALPALRRELQREWSGRSHGFPLLFSHLCAADDRTLNVLQDTLFDVIVHNAPVGSEIHQSAPMIVSRLSLDEKQKRRMASRARRKLHAGTTDDEALVRYYFGMFFLSDPDAAAEKLVDWLEHVPELGRADRAIGILSTLFTRNSAVLTGLHTASVPTVETLVRLAYRFVRREDDAVHDGPYSPDLRDCAEEARGALLAVLLERPGRETYDVVRALADGNTCTYFATRLRELTHGKAEKDGEFSAWEPREVMDYEKSHIAPAKTGEALLETVMGVLDEIRTGPERTDATSLPLLAALEDEDPVQEWLAEQLSLRSNGRFQIFREPQVAGGNKPDITVSSTAAPVSVAIEVKHGGKPWTVRQLEGTLTRQLAGKYLQPENRRWGILVLTHHGRRTWRHPDTGKTMEFPDVVERLKQLASETTKKRFGNIQVRVCGIDASTAGCGD